MLGGLIKWRRMRWAGHVARMEEGRGVHKVLVRKPEGKRPVGIPRRRWDYNIKMDIEEVGRGLWGLDGVEYGDELSGSIKCGEFLD